MRGQPAKLLRPSELRALLAWSKRSRLPQRNRVIVLLSFRAGLRACEIASLDWSMVLTATDRVAPSIELPAWAAKKGSGRRIPMHPELAQALKQLVRTADVRGSVVVSERRCRMSAKTIVNWFARVYSDLGLEGCSSHSGRRTFITSAARLIHKAGGSIRDVQQLAGHKSLNTTQSYIDGDATAQRKLMLLL
ncbi:MULTISPECIES: site-specific integrase [unclassified Mesorhizobium]|uniref:tyrosine-type recombinase/integrase n=1 Tax=unclassified Mesorhizobium TaxID=325217 RepID=UPI0003CE46F2|nr:MULTISPECIES: site-specific integrase [unclassified Mesorhizobium]ESY51339.1 integrase [Mesorhizobium sp. LNJC374B00]ESY56705.1 integrase [Mesorhizobium sp. LNJC372A00]WJI81999.1 site-specific integrase [Mesorhizobium sp. C374B]WJI88518.1 site-specific integrase [Mesorhizobium sp. C372A]